MRSLRTGSGFNFKCVLGLRPGLRRVFIIVLCTVCSGEGVDLAVAGTFVCLTGDPLSDGSGDQAKTGFGRACLFGERKQVRAGWFRRRMFLGLNVSVRGMGPEQGTGKFWF